MRQQDFTLPAPSAAGSVDQDPELLRRLLRDTDRPITEIAFSTGWESLGTFGRTFRDVTGESPGAIRARSRVAAQGGDRYKRV